MVLQTGGKRAKLLVYEYVPNGSLLEYIIGKLLSVTYIVVVKKNPKDGSKYLSKFVTLNWMKWKQKKSYGRSQLV